MNTLHHYIIILLFFVGLIYSIYRIAIKNRKIKDKQIQKLTQERDILSAAIFLYVLLEILDNLRQ